MDIPRRKLEGFVRDTADQCFSSRAERINRGEFFQNYFTTGSSDVTSPALYNKVFASVDDLESLLYSPVSLRFHIGDPDAPNALNEAKCRAASAKLRTFARQSETDTMISDANRVGLVKGKGVIKQLFKRGSFSPSLIQPEDMGVLRENVTQLDENMEAFAHTMLITTHQFARLVSNHVDKADLMRKARRYVNPSTGSTRMKNAAMPVSIGGLHPFQAASTVSASGLRGMVNWMAQPKPSLAPEVEQSLLELQEVWVWDDAREDWATFQIVGDDMLIMGKYQIINALAYDPQTKQSVAMLKGVHPFREFCANPVDDYFWGRSEISHLIGLQEAINARIAGINRLLRLQEDPTTKFVGSTGVNQTALARYRKPGGYWTDTNPNAKIEKDVVTIPQDLWGSLHEYERMFDDMMGLPPVAKGKGESGVRSNNHAQTLVRQFSPRFKDRALLTERSVEALGGLMLDLARAHDDRKLTAWVPQKEAGVEASEPDPLTVAPATGLVEVKFRFADLPENVTLTIDSHSSSPAFSQDAKALAFDLLKVGAMSAAELVEHVDATDPDELQMGIMRREIARAEAEKQKAVLKAMGGKQGKH